MQARVSATTSRKDTAVTFLEMTATGHAREAFDAYVDRKHFRHHNPSFRGDADSLAKAMEENAAQNPQKELLVEHALEDGDLVAVHSRVRLNRDAPEIAVVHVFRFKADRVVELWDVGQPVPADSPNENGMF